MKKNSSFKNIWSVLVMEMKFSKSTFVLLALGIPITLLIQFGGIYLPKVVLADLIAGKSFGTIILSSAIIIGALMLLKALDSAISGEIEVQRLRIQTSMLMKCHEKTYMTDYENIENSNNQNLMMRGTMSCYETGSGTSVMRLPGNIIAFITSILGYILFGTILSFASPWIILVLTITPLINFFAVRFYQKYEYKLRDKKVDLSKKINYITESAGNYKAIKDIKIYGLNAFFKKIFFDLTRKQMKIEHGLLAKSFFINLLDLLIILIRDGIAYAVLIAMVIKGHITVDEFVLYFAAVGTFVSQVGNILNKWNQIHATTLSIVDMKNWLDLPDKATHTEGGTKCADMQQPCKIEIKNLTYRYRGAENNTIKNISLNIAPGEKVAIVGPNGAGKTTLVKLLCGLYVPQNDMIFINGLDAKSFDIREYYKLFSVVFQDINFMPVSVAETVSSLPLSETDMDKVTECLTMAGMTNKVALLPDGILTKLDKQVNLQGVEFSGGERQKLALARAIYKNAPILILDEPTAALDPIAENELYLQYAKLCAGKTAIYISHRLSSTRFCDRILFIENGKIEEIGTHDQLMELNGKYAEMFHMQSSYYK